ncbi:MAG: DUF362 domain-containing protein [Calditrichaeota bacterium]|nr:DUF362 domain-containing protein [Calditrichota bacterium]
MSLNVSRRKFIQNSIFLGSSVAAQNLFSSPNLPNNAAVDITAASGNIPAKNARAAVNALGGMKKFVSKGDRVVLLPNPQGRQKGTSTNPHVVGETVKMCYEAGAGKVTVCSIHGIDQWKATGIIQAVKKAGGEMFYPSAEKDWADVSLPAGKILKKTRVIKWALENDVLINIPIAKQHSSARFTCNLKNLMGFNDRDKEFHQGSEHLHRCITDLSTLFNPTLCIVDANTILIENGPFGPGDTASPNKVFAGTDMVAVDALCCGLISLDPETVPHILWASQAGVGEIDLSKKVIREFKA